MPVLPLTLAAIRQPAFLYDADGRIAEANQQAEALAGRPLAGCSLADAIGIFDLRHPDGTSLAPSDLPACRALAGGVAVDVPFRVTASDGLTLHVLASASPLSEGDRIVGALSIWQDVSVLEAARACAETAATEARGATGEAPADDRGARRGEEPAREAAPAPRRDPWRPAAPGHPLGPGPAACLGKRAGRGGTRMEPGGARRQVVARARGRSRRGRTSGGRHAVDSGRQPVLGRVRDRRARGANVAGIHGPADLRGLDPRDDRGHHRAAPGRGRPPGKRGAASAGAGERGDRDLGPGRGDGPGDHLARVPPVLRAGGDSNRELRGLGAADPPRRPRAGRGRTTEGPRRRQAAGPRVPGHHPLGRDAVDPVQGAGGHGQAGRPPPG